MDKDIPYLLLTPGPLTTSRTVRQAMQRDLSTWDVDYNSVVQSIREQLVTMACPQRSAEHTAVLIQGSGTFAVEATLGSVVPPDGGLLVVSNGAYGLRMGQIAQRLRIPLSEIRQGETETVDLDRVRDNIMHVVAEQSATLENLDAVQSQIEDLQFETRRVIGNLETADIAAVAINLQNEQNLLQFTLATSVRMFDQSILDFLR